MKGVLRMAKSMKDMEFILWRRLSTLGERLKVLQDREDRLMVATEAAGDALDAADPDNDYEVRRLASRFKRLEALGCEATGHAASMWARHAALERACTALEDYLTGEAEVERHRAHNAHRRAMRLGLY